MRILLHLYHHKFREGCKTCSGYIKTLSPSVPSLYVPPACEATFASYLHNFFRHRHLCQFSFRSAIFSPVLSICSSFLIPYSEYGFFLNLISAVSFLTLVALFSIHFPHSYILAKKQYTYLSPNNHNS
jgi:hypothetical protein